MHRCFNPGHSLLDLHEPWASSSLALSPGLLDRQAQLLGLASPLAAAPACSSPTSSTKSVGTGYFMPRTSRTQRQGAGPSRRSMRGQPAPMPSSAKQGWPYDADVPSPGHPVRVRPSPFSHLASAGVEPV